MATWQLVIERTLENRLDKIYRLMVYIGVAFSSANVPSLSACILPRPCESDKLLHR